MTPDLAIVLISAGIKYGPAFITDIKTLLTKQAITIEDIEKLFADVKPYSAFGIPDLQKG